MYKKYFFLYNKNIRVIDREYKMSKKLHVSIYTIIDLILMSLFFILILPFLVDVSSVLFVNKSLNLFAFAKIFPVLFNYLNSDINL